MVCSKIMGLSKSNTVVIDTANSTPHLQRLFKSGNEDGSFFVPFAHTKRFAEMKSDASRSIIQTNIQRWASSGSVVTVDPTSFLSFDNSADGLVVRVGRQYPLGLGHDKTGFARDDGQRVNIPMLQFAIWYFAQTDLSTQSSDEIIRQLKTELNLEDSECELIFINKPIRVEYQDTPDLPNGEKLSIPEDTVFFFTMNTIDASTEDIDDALIGRMASVNFPPRIEALNSILISTGVDEEIREKIKNVFNSIQSVYPIGHGYFANIKSTTVFTKYYLSRVRPVLCNHFEAFKPEVIAQIDNVVDSLFIIGE